MSARLVFVLAPSRGGLSDRYVGYLTDVTSLLLRLVRSPRMNGGVVKWRIGDSLNCYLYIFVGFQNFYCTYYYNEFIYYFNSSYTILSPFSVKYSIILCYSRISIYLYELGRKVSN